MNRLGLGVCYLVRTQRSFLRHGDSGIGVLCCSPGCSPEIHAIAELYPLGVVWRRLQTNTDLPGAGGLDFFGIVIGGDEHPNVLYIERL